MTRWTILPFVISCLLLGQQSIGQTRPLQFQDTLVFQKKKNHEKKFRLPLYSYEVTVVPTTGKNKNVIITGFTDTTLTVKMYSFKKGDERKSKREQINKIYIDTSLTLSQVDSLTRMILYSIPDTISLSHVNKIKIYNGHRKEMKRLLSITEWSAVTWFIVGLPTIALFKSMGYYVGWNVAGIAIITVALITEKKNIGFKKWEIAY